MKTFNKFISALLYVVTILTCICCTYASSASISLDAVSEETLKNVTQILLLIGTGVCIGKVIQIGIMYVMTSANEKANAKAAIIPWLIGTFVCFGAATIGGYLIKLLEVSKDVLGY